MKTPPPSPLPDGVGGGRPTPPPNPLPRGGRGDRNRAGFATPVTPTGPEPVTPLDPPPPAGEGTGVGSVRPPNHFVVRRQRVDEAKVVRSRQLRREMTPAERALWSRLRDRQLDGLRFRRQQVIDGFIADFYCHAAGVVVEADGLIHDAQPEYDAERDRVFAARGLVVLRFRNDEVFARFDAVIARIASVCQERTPPPSPLPRGGRGNRTMDVPAPEHAPESDAVRLSGPPSPRGGGG